VSRIPQLCVFNLAVVLAAASARADDAAHRVVVLPISSLAVDPAATGKMRRQLSEALEEQFDVHSVASDETDRAVRDLCGQPSEWWDCLGRDESLFQLGRQLQAGWVVAGKLAAMGDTQALKFRTADVAGNTVSTEIINIRGADQEDFLARFLLLHQHRLPRHQPQEHWYQKWYVWTAAGAVVAAAVAGGLIWGLSTHAEEQWDFRRSLP
jgi:hypothetical protein